MNMSVFVVMLLCCIMVVDNVVIVRVICQVLVEYGLIVDKGYMVVDLNFDELYELYSQLGFVYWVVE